MHGNVYGRIYCVTNLVNGKQYVGQTTLTIEDRWDLHLKSALRYFLMGALHCAIRKYSAESFKIEQIDSAEHQPELNEKEARHVARLGTYGAGYNLTPAGDRIRLSEETRKKISESQAGVSRRPHSPETLKKMSESKIKYYALAENRRKTSESLKGRTLPEETRRRLSESHKGHVASVEARKRQSEAQLGKVRACCIREHPFSGDNLYVVPSNGVQVCLTCYYLRNNYKLPVRLQKYVTGKEVYNKKEKTAQ